MSVFYDSFSHNVVLRVIGIFKYLRETWSIKNLIPGTRKAWNIRYVTRLYKLLSMCFPSSYLSDLTNSWRESHWAKSEPSELNNYVRCSRYWWLERFLIGDSEHQRKSPLQNMFHKSQATYMNHPLLEHKLINISCKGFNIKSILCLVIWTNQLRWT